MTAVTHHVYLQVYMLVYMQVTGMLRYGFPAGTKISTCTLTRENPTREPARYMIPAVPH